MFSFREKLGYNVISDQVSLTISHDLHGHAHQSQLGFSVIVGSRPGYRDMAAVHCSGEYLKG